jgi:hypothetical protein
VADVQAQLNGRMDDLQQQIDDQTSTLATTISDETTEIDTDLGDLEALAVSRFDTTDANAAAFEASVDGSLGALLAAVNAETGEIDATLASFLTAFAEVYDWTDGMANPDPFTTTATTCAEFGGNGELGLEFTAEVAAEFEASFGADLFGTGVTADVKPAGSAAGKLEFLGFQNVFQEICYAGVEVVGTEDGRTASQDQAVLDYTQAAYDFQGQGGPSSSVSYNVGAGPGPVQLISYGGHATPASSHSGGSLLDIADALGASITGMGSALEALATVDAVGADPTALFSGTAFDDFVAAMGPGTLFDTEDLIAPFLDPCSTLAGLAAEAGAACEATEEGLAQTIRDIDTTVGVIEVGVVGVSNDVNGWLKTTVDDIDSAVDTVDTYMRNTLKSAVDGVRGVVNTIKSWTGTMKGWLDKMYDWVADAWDCVTLTGTCGNGH